MVITITNADNNLLRALKGVVNLHPQADLKVKKEPNLSVNDYTKKLNNVNENFIKLEYTQIHKDFKTLNKKTKNKLMKEIIKDMALGAD